MPSCQGRTTALYWRKSRASNESNQCVEIASAGTSVLVRDSNDLPGPLLAFGAAQWSDFLAGIRRED